MVLQIFPHRKFIINFVIANSKIFEVNFIIDPSQVNSRSENCIYSSASLTLTTMRQLNAGFTVIRQESKVLECDSNAIVMIPFYRRLWCYSFSILSLSDS